MKPMLGFNFLLKVWPEPKQDQAFRRLKYC
jgi:hypothetical protein